MDEHQAAAAELAAKVMARAQLGGITVTKEIRRLSLAVMRSLVAKKLTPTELLRQFIKAFNYLLRHYEPALVKVLSDANMAAWLKGGQGVAELLPAMEGPPPEPPRWVTMRMPGDNAPIVRFPIIEEAAADLAARNILTPLDYYGQANEERLRSFTVSRIQSLDALEKVRDALIDAVAKGETLRAFQGKVRDAFDASGLSEGRIELVFRNNVNAAYARGQKAVASNPLVRTATAFAWRTPIDDSRLTALCRALSAGGLQGKGIFCVDDPTWKKVAPISHHGCFVPDTEVQGRFSKGFRFKYNGKVVEITTRSGKRLTVTPNHPILTVDGFAAADTLKQGDNLLGYNGGIENRIDANSFELPVSLVSSDDARFAIKDKRIHNAPATIENVFGAIRNSDWSSAWRSPRTTDDFHGDARFGDSDIEIVGSDGPLLLNGNLAISQSIRNFLLAAMDMGGVFVSRIRHFLDSMPRNWLASNRTPRSRTLSFNGNPVLLNPSPLQCLFFGWASHLDASRYKPISDSGPAYAERSAERQHRFSSGVSLNNIAYRRIDSAQISGFGSGSPMNASITHNPLDGHVTDAPFARELRRRFPGIVADDEIVQIRYHHFRNGHVYDLQSPQGWILANGIFASNCRCSTVLLSPERAAEKGIVVAQRWVQTGLRPNDEDLFCPMPDLTGVPASEVLAFQSWVSPWSA